MTKSPSFWFGHFVTEGACAKATGAAIRSRAAARTGVRARARKVIGILQIGPLGGENDGPQDVAGVQATLFWHSREDGESGRTFRKGRFSAPPASQKPPASAILGLERI